MSAHTHITWNCILCRFWLHNTYLSMITGPVPSCNTFNTSHLMGIVRIRRVYLKIPSIGECTYVTAAKMLHWVLNKPQSSSHSFKQCCISVLTNTWNFEVNSFDPYYTHQMWCVKCVAWWYWSWYSPQISDILTKSAYVTSGFLSKPMTGYLM